MDPQSPMDGASGILLSSLPLRLPCQKWLWQRKNVVSVPSGWLLQALAKYAHWVFTHHDPEETIIRPSPKITLLLRVHVARFIPRTPHTGGIGGGLTRRIVQVQSSSGICTTKPAHDDGSCSSLMYCHSTGTIVVTQAVGDASKGYQLY